MTIPSLTITRPDDWHVHFRDGNALQHTVNASAKHFARALAMPNLQPALTTVTAILEYHARIIAAIHPTIQALEPYMTLYLNETITAEVLQQCKSYPFILGAKFYPAGATTHAEAGATSIRKLYPLLELMQDLDLVLQLHGEVTYGDIFAREVSFITKYLMPLINDFPKLRIVLEHISTQEAVDFIKQTPEHVVATITPHHLLYNRNQLLVGGIKPHYYCLPILKHERDQRALQAAAISGNNKFFAGTDSAPHAQNKKESACGCAGIYSAPYAIALYAEVFNAMDQLPKLNAFMGHFGADFYRLPRTHEQIELIKKPQIVPPTLVFGDTHVVPIAAEETLSWSIVDESV